METKDIQALLEENRKLAAQVKRLAEENAELSVKKAELEDTVSSLRAMMAWFRKRLFGKMSEKRLRTCRNIPNIMLCTRRPTR